MLKTSSSILVAVFAGSLTGCGGDDFVDLCQDICDRSAECLAEAGFPASADECKSDCERSAEEAEDVPEACIDRSREALDCYRSASCSELFSEDACAQEVAAAQAACPVDGGNANNNTVTCTEIDCSMCPTTEVEQACNASVTACTDQACCTQLAATYASCSGDSDACGYDCSICTDSTLRSACESGQAGCGMLSGANRTQCCDSIRMSYDASC